MELNPENLSDHDKEMLKVAEGGDPNDPSETNTGDPSTEENTGPELPEGVESVEDLIAKFNELNQTSDEESTEEEEGEEPSEEDGDDNDEETEEQSNELSDEELEVRELKAYELVGGKEKYAEMVEFAKGNLSEEHLDIYENAVMHSQDRNVALLAVKGLNAMYKLNQIEAFGQEGEMTDPSTGGLNVLTGYSTQSEMMAAMADPRYQTDPTYVAQVEQKIAQTNF